MSDKVVVIARSTSDEAIHSSRTAISAGLLRRACHRARIRATRWLAMTEVVFWRSFRGASKTRTRN